MLYILILHNRNVTYISGHMIAVQLDCIPAYPDPIVAYPVQDHSEPRADPRTYRGWHESIGGHLLQRIPKNVMPVLKGFTLTIFDQFTRMNERMKWN